MHVILRALEISFIFPQIPFLFSHFIISQILFYFSTLMVKLSMFSLVGIIKLIQFNNNLLKSFTLLELHSRALEIH